MPVTIQRNVALIAIKAYLLSQTGGTPESIRIGAVTPTLAFMGAPIVGLAQLRDMPERVDNNCVRRHLRLALYCGMAIDLVAAAPVPDSGTVTEADVQINATYEPIHALMEVLTDGQNASGAIVFSQCEEDQGGITFDVLADDKIAIRFCVSHWNVTYTRTLGTPG